MSDLIETFEHAGKTIRICIDSDPPNPIKEYENLVSFACWHRRLNLGHVQIQLCSEEDFRANADSNGEEILALLPLYLYEHSGITVSNSPFSCSFDRPYAPVVGVLRSSRNGECRSEALTTSEITFRKYVGQVGWAYVTRAAAEKMGCVGDRHDYQDGKPVKVGTWDEAALQESIRGETETYAQYLRGEVYGYEVLGRDGECLDSCWGFFGDLEYVRGEARNAAEGSDDPAIDREAEELQSRATYAAG